MRIAQHDKLIMYCWRGHSPPADEEKIILHERLIAFAEACAWVLTALRRAYEGEKGDGEGV